MDKLEFDNFETNASDYKCGQEVNDDARTNEEQQAIEFSSSVIAALEQKVKEHNAKGKGSKATLGMLKAVYRSSQYVFKNEARR